MFFALEKWHCWATTPIAEGHMAPHSLLGSLSRSRTQGLGLRRASTWGRVVRRRDHRQCLRNPYHVPRAALVTPSTAQRWPLSPHFIPTGVRDWPEVSELAHLCVWLQDPHA